uniref:Uncharacterized protein n=1 Tax=Oryza brachyantha TaxID=4533 RepID=J3MX43_ORYBR
PPPPLYFLASFLLPALKLKANPHLALASPRQLAFFLARILLLLLLRRGGEGWMSCSGGGKVARFQGWPL